MTADLELNLDTPAANDEPREPSPQVLALRQAHAAHPEAKLIHLTDTRNGVECVLAIPPSSPWHELLPPWQYATLTSRVSA